jgi:hypothetical protein
MMAVLVLARHPSSFCNLHGGCGLALFELHAYVTSYLSLPLVLQ